MSILKNLADSEVFNGKLVVKEYDFYELGNVKILYPNDEDIKSIVSLMFKMAKADEETGEVWIEFNVTEIIHDLIPMLTNIDTSDVTEEDINKIIKNGHPEITKIIDDISEIVKAMSDIFIDNLKNLE